MKSGGTSARKEIAKLIPAGSNVIEFGAGRRQLEKFLPAGCTYTPSDLVDRGPGTIVCDLNRPPLPDLRHLRLKVAVFGGVLEYVADVLLRALVARRDGDSNMYRIFRLGAGWTWPFRPAEGAHPAISIWLPEQLD